MSSKTLHIKLTNLTISSPQRLLQSYYSFSYGQYLYFSSYFDHDSQSHSLNDDIIIPLAEEGGDQKLPQKLILQRWEHHMVMFVHEVDISDLKSRSMVRKSYQGRQGEVLEFEVKIVETKEIVFAERFLQGVSQHYIKITNVQMKQTRKRGDPGPSFFVIATSSSKYILPTTNAIVYLQLPQQIQILHYRNGQLFGKSHAIPSPSLASSPCDLQLFDKSSSIGHVRMRLQWAINFHKPKAQNNLLLDAEEIMIYEVEIKFQNFNQFGNGKVKVVYGNKAFEMVADANSKIMKIRKIIYFMVRSDQEEVNVVVQKNMKPIAHCKFFTDQIAPFQVNHLKKKITENIHGKVIGHIKFKCQKGKQLSVPQNNLLWKEVSRKKTTNVNFLLAVQQISVRYDKNENLMVSFKTQEKEEMFAPLRNFTVFQLENPDYQHQKVLLSAKPQQNVYLMLRKHQRRQKNTNSVSQTDFIGIAVLNPSTLRLGKSCIELPAFKNQEQTATLNFLLTKIPPYPFLRSIFQPESILPMSSSLKQLSINLFINKILFTPYFHSFKYDGKNELYCIVQINRTKKVLILNSTVHNPLMMVCEAGSDSLEFQLEGNDFLKIKLVFLVSDVGQDQEIYGTAIVKCKSYELYQQLAMDFHQVQIKNGEGNVVGWINIEVSRGVSDLLKNKGQLQNQLKQIQKDLSKVNQNVILAQRSLDRDRKHINERQPRARKTSQNLSENSKHRYSQHQTQRQVSSKLPLIKQKKNQKKLQQILNHMKVRKRGMGGTYEQTSGFSKLLDSRNDQFKTPPIDPKQPNNVDLTQLQKNNPNLSRNFQILFPKKINNKNQHSLEHSNNQPQHPYQRGKNKFMKERKRRPANHQTNNQLEYDDRFKNMKSIMNQISNDIGEVEPTIKSSRAHQLNDIDLQMGDDAYVRDIPPEFQGNQFAVHFGQQREE